MPTENRSSNTELSKIVTDALADMVSGVTGMRPPADEPLPGFIQAPIDRAVERIAAFLVQADGFSAGDMADQGAKAFRDGQRALVLPERMGESTKGNGWNACLDEVRRLNMLANQGE